MWDDITCEDLHLANVAGMDDIPWNDLKYDDLNPKCEIMGRIDDIMCDDITCEDLHLASVAGMDDIPRDDLKYDDLNPEYLRPWDRLMIHCVTT